MATSSGAEGNRITSTLQLESRPLSATSPGATPDKGTVIRRKWWRAPSRGVSSGRAPEGWKTTPYILGNEVSERMASFSLTWTLVLYLVQRYHLKREDAAYTMSVMSGIIGLTPLLGAFLADTYLGRFRSILLGSVSYFLGMLSLLLTSVVPTLTPTKCDVPLGQVTTSCEDASKPQLYFLYISFMFLAVGAGGLRPCLYAFGADQFAQNTKEEGRQLQSFFNWYYVGLTFAMLMASTVVAYVQLEVSWTWGFAFPSVLVVFSIFIFLRGTHLYLYVAPEGSPFTNLARVIVAAYRKRHVQVPVDRSKLHEANVGLHTEQFRFVDKAAVVTESEKLELCEYDHEETTENLNLNLKKKKRRKNLAWRLCGVPEVESLKCVLRVFPIWVAGVMPGCYLVQQGVWLPLQAATMDRKITAGFHIPASSMVVFSIVATIVWLPLYDRLIVPVFQKRTPGGITLLQRIGVGYVMLFLGALVAGGVEAKRRALGGQHLSAFWLAPQMVILGVAEAFSMVGQVEYMYQQMPSHMRSVAGAMFSCTIAIGSFLGSIILAIVEHVTSRHGHKWIDNSNLDHGHLDYYYYVLAVLLFVNFIYFLYVTLSNTRYRPISSTQSDHNHSLTTLELQVSSTKEVV